VAVTPRQRLGWIVGIALAVAGPLGGSLLPFALYHPVMTICSLVGL
jgi:hypothetical protein